MKIKNLFNCLVALVLLASCGEAKKEEENKKPRTDSSSAENKNMSANNVPLIQTMDNLVTDLYVGDFVAEKADEKKVPMLLNRITVSIDSVKNNILFGYSVVAGNKRFFKGPFSKNKAGFAAEVKEPGDNKYDGVFTFALSSEDHKLRGEWTANDAKLAVTKRKFSLQQTTFEYNPKQQGLEINGMVAVYNPATGEQYEGEIITNDAAKINASLEALKESDVENMYKRDLEVMRNAIYARHGYSFKNREMRYFFDTQVDWYIPYSTNVTKELSSIEKQNIELIKRYEDHATAYYDSFGR